MRALLASGGYPWTVILVEGRAADLEALERASVGGDIGPFARFVAAKLLCTTSVQKSAGNHHDVAAHVDLDAF